MMLGGARSTIHDHHPNPHDHAINPSSSLRSASDLNQTQGQQLPCEQLQLEVLWLSTFPHNLHSQAHYLVLSLRVSCYSWSVLQYESFCCPLYSKKTLLRYLFNLLLEIA
jgi:hypothetical protein